MRILNSNVHLRAYVLLSWGHVMWETWAAGVNTASAKPLARPWQRGCLLTRSLPPWVLASPGENRFETKEKGF